jgi:hypothetical protein
MLASFSSLGIDAPVLVTCCGFLSREKIEAGQNGPTRGYFEKNRQEAQVVSFNGVLASQAVTEVLQLLTGFRGVGLRREDLRIVLQPSAAIGGLMESAAT